MMTMIVFDNRQDLLDYAENPTQKMKTWDQIINLPIGFEVTSEKNGKYEYEIFVDRYQFPKVSSNYINSLAA